MEDYLFLVGSLVLAAYAVASGSKTKSSQTVPFNESRGNPLIDGNKYSFRPPKSSKKKSSRRTPTSRKSA